MSKVSFKRSVSLVLSGTTIALLFSFALHNTALGLVGLGGFGFLVLFVCSSVLVALAIAFGVHYAASDSTAARVVASRDHAIALREKALNEHTIISVSHPDGSIASINQNFVDALGYEREELIGASPASFYWNGDIEFMSVRDIVVQGQVWKGRQRLRRKDGRPILVDTSIIPNFDDAGRLQSTISIRTDLSAALSEGAEEGRNAIVEALPDEVYIYDADDFSLEYANENARRRMGYGMESLRGHILTELFTEEEKERFRLHIGPILRGETGAALIEIENARGNAEVLTHITEQRDGSRKLVSVVRDISERKTAQEIKLRSVATASHEMRTPLTSIAGALKLLDAGVVGELDPEPSRMVAVAIRNSDRLLALVNDILDLGKLSSGELELDIKPVDLRSLFEEAMEETQGFAEGCGVTLSFEVPDMAAWVEGDAGRIKQVMSNLMSNAAKFSPYGSDVVLKIEDRSECWRVSVADAGPGIPDHARDTLFEAYTQVASIDSRNYRGTGLGLAISREIMTRLGGRIDFVSEVGKGSTFFFELAKLKEGSLVNARRQAQDQKETSKRVR